MPTKPGIVTIAAHGMNADVPRKTLRAYVPDLPGCTSFGPTQEEVARNVHEAIEQHIAALRDTGQPVPEALSLPEVVHVA